MRSMAELGDIDIFFFYGQSDLDLEIEHDIMLGLLQAKRSLFYFRSDGAGISGYENHPNSLLLEVGLRYDIVSWMARRNTYCGDGEDNTIDRRVATSQMPNAIKIKRANSNLDIQILYVPYKDIETPKIISYPIGGVN